MNLINHVHRQHREQSEAQQKRLFLLHCCNHLFICQKDLCSEKNMLKVTGWIQVTKHNMVPFDTRNNETISHFCSDAKATNTFLLKYLHRLTTHFKQNLSRLLRKKNAIMCDGSAKAILTKYLLLGTFLTNDACGYYFVWIPFSSLENEESHSTEGRASLKN